MTVFTPEQPSTTSATPAAGAPLLSARRLNRVAWLTIWAAFALFCILCVGAGYTAAWVRATAKVSDRAELTSPSGTVLMQPRGFAIWNNSRPGLQLREGEQVRTEKDSSAYIRLPDGSTLELFPETQVRFDTIERGRFLPEVRTTAIRVFTGIARLTTAPPRSPKSRFAVNLPWGTAQLDPGSYVARVHEPTIELTTGEQGRAYLTDGPGQGLIVDPDQRATFEGAAKPQILPARQNLLVDGGFAGLLENSWQTGIDRKFGGNEDVLGSVERVTTEGRPALYFRRTGSKGSWTETSASQYLDQSLAGYRSLTLRLQVKLVYQNVPGGGYLGSEYPFLVRLKFRNPGGQPIWVRGFFYQNDGANPTTNGQAIEHGQWFTYESPNLLGEIASPAESELLGIALTASGHDYASYVRDVELIAE